VGRRKIGVVVDVVTEVLQVAAAEITGAAQDREGPRGRVRRGLVVKEGRTSSC